MTRGREADRDLVLVGGGHTHVQVLRSWASRPAPGVRLSLVVDTPLAVYSGMVPGCVAGQYRRHELEIDVRPLARRAGARVVVAKALQVDPGARHVELEGRAPLRYDVASFDVGSIVAGLDLPGVREHALPTRPIGQFVARVEALLARARGRARLRVVVVGGGAGGVELGFALCARLARTGVPELSVQLLEAGPRVLGELPPGVATRALRSARAAGLAIRCGARVARVERDRVVLEDGEALECDAVVWVVGAAAQPLLSALPNERGFVRVRPTLQIEGHDALLAAGDCAHLIEHPDTPKAGVYAVRQGPVLTHNLHALLAGRPLRAYVPQRDFLSLLNLADGRAIGSKRGLSFEGRWVFALKDWIDRRFVRRFQVLAEDGGPLPAFPALVDRMDDARPCGGCAAKLGESALERALRRVGARVDPDVVLGLAAPDDAAAVETARGELVVSSLDAFRAFSDDAFLVGRVAATNAVSDLHAKGVAPRFALAQVTVPERDSARAEETLYQVLAGARAALDPERVTLVGGHTAAGDALAVGFAVSGFAPSADRLLRVGGLGLGDRLVLTKALGTGVLLRADMQGAAPGEWIEAAVASMLRSNGPAAGVALELEATACTDVSGFGLAGHLGEMLRASKVSATLALSALPLLPGAAALLGRGVRSTLHPENARIGRYVHLAVPVRGRPEIEVLYDPQTSGGLLFGIAAERAGEVLVRLHEAGDPAAAVIGAVTPPREDGALVDLVDSL